MPRLYATARSVELLAASSFTLVEVTLLINEYVCSLLLYRRSCSLVGGVIDFFYMKKEKKKTLQKKKRS